MSVELTLSAWWLVWPLAYFLIGALVVAVHQTACSDGKRWEGLFAFMVFLFWLPIGVFWTAIGILVGLANTNPVFW